VSEIIPLWEGWFGIAIQGWVKINPNEKRTFWFSFRDELFAADIYKCEINTDGAYGR